MDKDLFEKLAHGVTYFGKGSPAITKESLWLAYNRYNFCDQHSYIECQVLNNLHNIAVEIENGMAPDDAYARCREEINT